MKLPEPVAVMDRDGDVYKALPTPNWHPPHTNLYSEMQLKAEIERRDAVLRMARDVFVDIKRDDDDNDFLFESQSAAMTAAIKAIQEVLG